MINLYSSKKLIFPAALLILLNVFYKKTDETGLKISLSEFLTFRKSLSRIIISNKLKPEMSDGFKSFLDSNQSYASVVKKEKIHVTEIEAKLKAENFLRTPTSHQLENISFLCRLNAGADFSVPGAGKTTTALGYYTFNKNSDSKLLVICPPNAFISWDTEVKQCISKDAYFTRLRGNAPTIKNYLSQENEFFIINYDSLRNISKLNHLIHFLKLNSHTTVILDESHKSKGEKISNCIRNIAPLVSKKLILTGTPMPNKSDDLVPQFRFLYPNEFIPDADELIRKFEPIFVRTTKGKDGLNLKPVIIKHEDVDPYPEFLNFYEKHFVTAFKRGDTLEKILNRKKLTDAVMKTLQLHSNQLLCEEEIRKIDSEAWQKIKNENNRRGRGYGSKFDAVIDKANELIDQGEKVLIWSTFKKNVENLARQFSPSQSVYIHGGVATEKESQSLKNLDSRESKINRFKNDPECMVMVANPASTAESISLHEVCNHALYLDRNYNAAQFLQSQDRIHRLIDPRKEKQKYIWIFRNHIFNSIDWKVEASLARKTQALGRMLEIHLLVTLLVFSMTQIQMIRTLKILILIKRILKSLETLRM